MLTGYGYQRSSNEIAQWGNLCDANDYTGCYHPSISGGFPFAFAFDQPGASVEDSLCISAIESLCEDQFRWYPFIVDCWFYLIAFIFSYIALKSLRDTSR
jgi:hypothetical protein